MPILRLAGKAPRRRRPVNSALDLTMNLGLRTFLFGLAAQATCGAAIAQAASAPPAAEPQYTIKADEPRLGSYIRPDKFRGKSIALNLPYAQLPDKDRQAL